MQLIADTQKAQAPTGLNISRIPSPMHSSSRMQGVTTQPQQQNAAVRNASPEFVRRSSLQLPEPIFTQQMQGVENQGYGVARAEDMQCVTPSEAMMQSRTPLASATPSNVATTHWRTMVCPNAPAHPGKRPANVLRCQTGGYTSRSDTPSSLESPANYSNAPTPHRLLSFNSLPSTPMGSSTPTGLGLNTAFIASTPTNSRRGSKEEVVTRFGMMRSFSGISEIMTVDGDTTPSMRGNGTPMSLSRGTPRGLLVPEQPQRFNKLLSM